MPPHYVAHRWLVVLLIQLQARKGPRTLLGIGGLAHLHDMPLLLNAKELRLVARHRRALCAAFRMGEPNGHETMLDVWDVILNGSRARTVT